MIFLPTHRRAMMSALSRRPADYNIRRLPRPSKPLRQTPPAKAPSTNSLSPDAASPQVAARPPLAPKNEGRKPTITPTKAVITVTPGAVRRLRVLLKGPTPQLIRIGVRNKGCAGLSYHLEYVDKPGKFDEVVEQDGVKVLIDSKALFSLIGSEMDWHEDALSAKFVFKNPNNKVRRVVQRRLVSPAC
ncbi:uncharacterized protein B0H18DRAFT_872399 [Fomitopsis serialis]|uniref:uncharacterized protein n=1 Tax=Fomitopsis serialis TaxID=139415 RepID=UPI00200758F2|nr:uncharacterized protein B0H18DRAFT_872399 [Neoantrodia serialis]KAH9931219.1 hypothetical protein B0H18DRAFT_872399 [Neoantrodia serialis]